MAPIAFQRTGFVVMIPIFVSLAINVVEEGVVAAQGTYAVGPLAVYLHLKYVAVVTVAPLMTSVAAKAAANRANIAVLEIFAVLMTMTAAAIIAVPRGINVVGRPAASLHRPAVVTTAAQPASTVATPLQGAVMIRILQAAIHVTAKSVAMIAYLVGQYVVTEVADIARRNFPFAVPTVVVVPRKRRFVVVLAAVQQDRPAVDRVAVQLVLLATTIVFVAERDMYHVVLAVCLKELLVAMVKGGVRLVQIVVMLPYIEVITC